MRKHRSLFTPIILLFLAGCQAESTSAPVAKQPGEPSWREQVEAVKSKQIDTIHIQRQTISDKQLRQLAGAEILRELLIDAPSEITDDGVRHLAGLSHLQHVRIRGGKVGDAGLQALSRLPRLRFLNLPQGDFSNEALAALENIEQLEMLRISSPHVTDAGMPHIAAIDGLRFLHLIGIPITDAGLKHLLEIETLESLYLDGADVSEAGYQRLFETRPDLHVHLDQQHHDLDPQASDHRH